MAQRLTGMEIDKVALVDRGANGRPFAVFKRDSNVADVQQDAAPNTERGFLSKVAGALGWRIEEAAPVTKVDTFATIVAGHELTDALSDSWYTLESALWTAIYAKTDEGADMPLSAKQALVAQNLDEFKAYLLGQMEQVVDKRDDGELAAAGRRIDELVEKVGKKVSAARLEQLRTAHAALAAVIAEAEGEVTEKRAPAQEETMTGEELAKALEPFTTRLDAIDKKLDATPAAAAVAKGDETEADGDDAVSLSGIAKAITGLADRMERLEKRAGVRTSVDGQEGGETPVKKGAGGLASAFFAD